MTPSRALLNNINKLKECFAATTAALAPYPVVPIGSKKKNENSKTFGKGFLAILISLAVMLVTLAICITIKTVKNQKLQKTKEYNESPGTIIEVARYQALLDETNYLNNQYK